MRLAACDKCGTSFALAQLWQVSGKTLCGPCRDAELRKMFKSQTPPEGAARPLVDPTVCGSCKMDNGDQELPRIAGVPLCESCRRALARFPLPTWAKFGLLTFL